MPRQYNLDPSPGDQRTFTDDTLMPFGKHKGIRLADVPADYLLWLWDNGVWQKTKDPLHRYITDHWSDLLADAKDTIPLHKPGDMPEAQAEAYEPPEITMIPTEDSTQIAEIGHDPMSQTLRIRFRKGGLYDYANFTDANFDAFKNSESKGVHFYQYIKPNAAAYPYRKLA